MEKRKQRTPQQLIAETEAKLERMRLREAQTLAKDDPALSPLMEEKADLAKLIRESKKLLGNGPQSAIVRVQKHEAWINKIQGEVDDAQLILDSAESRLTELNSEIATAISAIVPSKEISAEA
jgi:cell fate (sporulation/competence/biofilm development) regulator YlbF (YheA/YmcA/DUF963 family)